MKAVRIHEHGGAEKLRYEQVDEPGLGSPGAVLVRLKAASLNRIDILNREGLTGMEVPMPHILGADGAGVVAEVGAEVTNVRPGDRVCLYPPSGCGVCEFCHSDREFMCIRLRVLGERIDGTYAELVRVPAENCFPIPPEFSFHEAAAFPLVFVTVWRMLITNAAVRPGEYVLILGIGGGIATAALQLAKLLNARVIVTSSSDEKLEMARRQGADHGLNYRSTDFAREARALTGKRGVDVVVDCVGGDSWTKSLAALAKGGRLVTCGATTGPYPQTDLRRIFWNHLSIFGSTLGSRHEFGQLLRLIRASRLKPIIDRVFPLRDAADAHRRLEQGRQFGKIVLEVEEQ